MLGLMMASRAHVMGALRPSVSFYMSMGILAGYKQAGFTRVAAGVTI